MWKNLAYLSLVGARTSPLPRSLVMAAPAVLEERPTCSLFCVLCSPGAPDTFPQAQMSRASHFPCKYFSGKKPNI